MKLILRTVLIIGLAVGCASAITLPPIAPAGINASFAKTWDVMIDILSEGHIQVKTLDKASGYIVADDRDVESSQQDSLADCGSDWHMGLASMGPMIAEVNIVVRGDSTMSTVTVRARFTKTGNISRNCPSKNVLETYLQAKVKARAEAR
jgi:hypothetical protein